MRTWIFTTGRALRVVPILALFPFSPPGFSAVSAAEPEILFQDRFNGTPIGARPGVPPWTTVNSDDHADHESIVRRDGHNLFGRGTDNRYLEFRDASDLSASLQVGAIDVFAEEVVTLGFYVYEPDDPAYNNQLTVQLFAGSGSRTVSNRAQVFRFRSGAIPQPDGAPAIDYGMETPRRVDLVVNNSDSPVTYGDGESVASGLAHVWIDGQLRETEYSFARESETGPIRSVDFSTFSNHNQRIFLDAITVFRGAVVGADTAPPPQEVAFPLALEPNREVDELFGYRPDYTRNVPSFDSRNRPYIRSRTVDYNETSFVHTWRNNGWIERDFLQAIRTAYPDFESVYRGAGWIGSRVVFDSEDRAYTIVNIRLTGGGHRNLLLFSEDHGESWEVHELSRGGVFAMEHFVGHNEIAGPPFLLLSRRGAGDHPGDWASYHEFHYLQPRIEDGQLVVPSYTSSHINDKLISLGQHSGGASFSVTKDGKTHFVWIEATEEEVPGTPTYVATYDHETRTLGDPEFLAYAPPANNSHNRPGIVMDSEGYLHVVTGSHHGQNFYYTRSREPNDAYSGWTDPEPVWDTGWTAISGEERGGQTYVALVCDPDDTLHLVFRHWRDADEYFTPPSGDYYAALSYQRKPKGGEWSEPRPLVLPERGRYSVYYHKLAVDRVGRLFLSFSYFDWELNEQATDPDERYWRRMVIVSDDGGDEWKLAGNRDFDDRWLDTPYHAWRREHFSNTELDQPSLSGPEASPAGDNLSNLLKYALCLDPHTPSAHLVPMPALDDNRLTLELDRRLDDPELVYRVEISGDLENWYSGPEHTEETGIAGSGDQEDVERVRIRDLTTSGESPRRFMRLRVERSDD